ncbi:MAG: sulfite reductase subunit A [Chloroflexi bacterium]|nr:sulfite reductase subunit A [Chloroflexota bacterium]
MTELTPDIGAYVSIDKEALESIFRGLKQEGYTLIGPTLGEGAIVYDEIDGMDDLPIGWTDRQEAATYRLHRRDDQAVFGYVVGPHSWKRFLFPPVQKLMTIRKQNGSFSVEPHVEEPPRYAFIGVRGCELQAIHIQDRVFLGGPYQDPDYKARRQLAFVLAVNCTEPGATCFCASMDTGPKAGPGFDLGLTELDDVFVIEVGSEMGRRIMSGVRWRPAGAFELQTMRERLTQAEKSMGRHMDISDLPALLYQNLEHPRWDQVAERCLSCANCTMVCPTCFCSDVQEVSDLLGETNERVRVWDSCFSLQFSHVHGGNIRPHVRSRYRQWMTHKLASWVDQFGTLGCVGCGRCITWCPVGIDITEEITAIRGEV